MYLTQSRGKGNAMQRRSSVNPKSRGNGLGFYWREKLGWRSRGMEKPVTCAPCQTATATNCPCARISERAHTKPEGLQLCQSNLTWTTEVRLWNLHFACSRLCRFGDSALFLLIFLVKTPLEKSLTLPQLN